MKTFIAIKLKQVVLLILTLFALLLMTLLSSCKKSAEKAHEKIMETAIGNNANVDMDDEKIVIKTDEGTFTSDATANSWPDAIPNDVPEFKDGKIVNVSTQVVKEGKNWTLLFEEVDDKALNEYEAKLKENGFKVSSITMGGANAHVTGEKGDLFVVIMGGDGMASLSVGTNK